MKAIGIGAREMAALNAHPYSTAAKRIFISTRSSVNVEMSLSGITHLRCASERQCRLALAGRYSPVALT